MILKKLKNFIEFTSPEMFSRLNADVYHITDSVLLYLILLFLFCRTNKGMTVTEMKTGKVIATIPIGAGVDAVAYDKENALIFCSNGDGTTTVIRQDSPDKYQVIQTIQTQYRAKTMALDPQTHKIYLSAVDFQPGTKTRIPGTFKILVFIPPAI